MKASEKMSKILNGLSTFSFLLVAHTSMACTNSPLMNHTLESPASRELQPKADDTCPLEFKKSDLCARWEWVKQSTDEEAGEAKIFFWKKSTGTPTGPYVSPAYSVGVKLWMATMGHGSAPVKVRSLLDSAGKVVEGVYSASEISFVMGGPWEVWVQLKENKTVVDQAKFDIEI